MQKSIGKFAGNLDKPLILYVTTIPTSHHSTTGVCRSDGCGSFSVIFKRRSDPFFQDLPVRSPRLIDRLIRCTNVNHFKVILFSLSLGVIADFLYKNGAICWTSLPLFVAPRQVSSFFTGFFFLQLSVSWTLRPPILIIHHEIICYSDLSWLLFLYDWPYCASTTASGFFLQVSLS